MEERCKLDALVQTSTSPDPPICVPPRQKLGALVWPHSTVAHDITSKRDMSSHLILRDPLEEPQMLTGQRNMDGSHPKEERNLVKWSRAFLADDCRLSLIMDPQLTGRFPAKAARSVADIAQRCLQVEPSERPTMRNIVEQLKVIQDVKYSCRFPLREPAPVAVRKHMGRSSSLNTIVWTPAVAAPPRSSFSPSPPAGRPSVSPTRGQGLMFPQVFQGRVCSSLEMSREEVWRLSLGSGRRTSLEGF